MKMFQKTQIALTLGFFVYLWSQTALCQVLHHECAMGDTKDAKEFAEWYEEQRTYDDILKRIESWVQDYPEWVEVWDARIPDGTSDKVAVTDNDDDSEGGNHIKVVRIGKNIGPQGKPAALIIGGVHAREPIAHMSAMYTLERLLFELDHNNYQVWDLMAKTEVFAFPIINPDGYIHVSKNNFGDDGLPNYVMFYDDGIGIFTWDINGRNWRKNRRVTEDEWGKLGVKINTAKQPDPELHCRGVDINRNWDVGRNAANIWEMNPCADGYIGAIPEGEVETQAIKYLLASFPQIHRALDFHGPEQRIFWPTVAELEEMPGVESELYKPIVNNMLAAMNAVHVENKIKWKDPSSPETDEWIGKRTNQPGAFKKLGAYKKNSCIYP